MGTQINKEFLLRAIAENDNLKNSSMISGCTPEDWVWLFMNMRVKMDCSTLLVSAYKQEGFSVKKSYPFHEFIKSAVFYPGIIQSNNYYSAYQLFLTSGFYLVLVFPGYQFTLKDYLEAMNIPCGTVDLLPSETFARIVVDAAGTNLSLSAIGDNEGYTGGSFNDLLYNYQNALLNEGYKQARSYARKFVLRTHNAITSLNHYRPKCFGLYKPITFLPSEEEKE